MVSKNWSQESKYFSGSSSVVVLLGKIEVVHRVIATKSPRQAPTGNEVFVNSLWHKIDDRGIGCIDQTFFENRSLADFASTCKIGYAA